MCIPKIYLKIDCLLKPLQVKNSAPTKRHPGRGCESLGYCCTCPDTKKG